MLIWSEFLYRLAVIFLFVSFVVNTTQMFYRAGFLSRTSHISTHSAWVAVTLSLILRWWAKGHFPATTHYETLVFILFVALTVFVYLERRLQWSILNVAFLGLSTAVLMYSLTLPRAVEPILPVLRRPWVAFHVSLNVASYGLFALSFVFGLLYLVQEYQLKRKRISFFYYLLPPLDRLEFFSARLIKWGFPLLTAGIVAGSIYAHSVWGSFWDWRNVKMTWSFVTWLIYAYYLYLRHGRGWVGRRAVLWAVFGFMAIVANYGVSLWVATPHSFIQQVLK